ncbi:MAG: lipopolysaccharide transport system ATP-binding protein [Fimbriimonadaceae bacterium]|nr:lipopolysaccharide transport system ATP-binding protein [Fimbriimonadaceae bacterium]
MTPAIDAPKIRIRDLHKTFVVHDVHVGTIKSLLLRAKHLPKPKRDYNEVLNGVNLDIHRRECVAIVGRNGAGKSTMLGIIANVHRPTSGTVEINGRIAPLLELGSGFHPDLSGIENIFFNGMLLGLTQDQIKERLSEIVAFSEIGEYIDAPIRTYSSGMVARLGFAVASHVDAEILIVDESLAVGDYNFVRKCYAFIRRFQMRGGTILFVSHAAAAVTDIATRCVWLENGVVKMDGDPKEVIQAYQSGGVLAEGTPLP